jgi:hypothetical protein
LIIGDVVPLCQLRGLVDLVPHFHKATHWGLTDRNSSSYSAEFFLNKYFHKDMFHKGQGSILCEEKINIM